MGVDNKRINRKILAIFKASEISPFNYLIDIR
jgi:hypothetical protein